MGAVVAGCCSCGGSTGPQYASGYAALPPSCAAVGTAAGDALHQFAGALPAADARPVTTFKLDNAAGQALTCAITYEDPIPHSDKVSTPEPLSRTARIQLWVSTTPTWIEQTTTSLSASGAPTPVPGIGDQADIATSPVGKNQVAVTVRTRLDNLAVSVDTQGLNWSGASGTVPTGDSPGLRNDLGSGAESIAAALIHSLSASLPRKTLRPEFATTTAPVTTTDPPITPAPQPVWDPCTIPDADVTAAGLNPQSKKPGTRDPKHQQCQWIGPSYDVAVFTSDSRFTDWAYEIFTRPQPVTVGDRRALLALRSSAFDEPSCTLLFDIPQGTHDGIKTGVIEVDASINASGDRDALCAELTHLAVPLTQHFPTSR
ncbi:DUF3558 family protein [Nocardia sp. NPDC060256]|uniref:DUF3558 family protein n=1 Tax=unclassified Nocardia TaxID=2637762 RepID=UPI0036642E30